MKAHRFPRTGARNARRIGVNTLAAVLLSCAGGLVAEDIAQHRSTGGLDIYWGVVPAELVLGHEQEHGGAKSARNAHHLVVAAFSTATGERISKAEIEARVEPFGLGGETKALESMTINQVVSFGNWFHMPGRGPYRITLKIRLPGAEDWIETTVEYHHGSDGG